MEWLVDHSDEEEDDGGVLVSGITASIAGDVYCNKCVAKTKNESCTYCFFFPCVDTKECAACVLPEHHSAGEIDAPFHVGCVDKACVFDVGFHCEESSGDVTDLKFRCRVYRDAMWW